MTEEDTERIANAAKSCASIVTDYVASVNWRRTFNNTILPLAALAGWFDTVTAPLAAGQYVAASAEIRALCVARTTGLMSFLFVALRREDVYKGVAAFRDTEMARDPSLSDEQRRLTTLMAFEMERGGLNLPAWKQGSVKEMQEKVAKLDGVSSRCVRRETVKYRSFRPRGELGGLPKEWFGDPSRGRDFAGRFKLSLSPKDYRSVMARAEDGAVRKDLMTVREWGGGVKRRVRGYRRMGWGRLPSARALGGKRWQARSHWRTKTCSPHPDLGVHT
jgi:Zn-dependent oligopeptidase